MAWFWSISTLRWKPHITRILIGTLDLILIYLRLNTTLKTTIFRLRGFSWVIWSKFGTCRNLPDSFLILLHKMGDFAHFDKLHRLEKEFYHQNKYISVSSITKLIGQNWKSSKFSCEIFGNFRSQIQSCPTVERIFVFIKVVWYSCGS